ncbi:hypothetical protein P5V15_010925 [Pogonomyrmex californicus]
MSATRNRFLPTLGVARRFVAAVDVDHVHVAGMAVRRTCSPAYRWNAACWRLLDHNVRMTHSVTQPWIRTKDECQEMMALWPDVAHDLMEGNDYRPKDQKWMAEVLQYNVPGGKKTRGLTVTYAYKLLASNNQLTENNIRLTRILGLCIGMLQAYSLLLDEVPDRLLLRKYLPEWYSDGFGAPATDSVMLKFAFDHVMTEHFLESECYDVISDLFEEIMWETIRYQWSESKFINFDKKLNLNLFTMHEYDSIVQYKTSNFSFLLPVITAMHFAGVNNVDCKLRQAKDILLNMGHLFQVQDDYLAIFGNIDKDSSDIEEGKCTWLVVEALQQATPEQRKILKECYNSSDPEKVRRVKQLFIDLGLPNAYSIYEEKKYNLLNKKIQRMSRGPLHSFFLDLLGKLYRRVV